MTRPSTTRWRIGFDIGGTFTDFILYDDVEVPFGCTSG